MCSTTPSASATLSPRKMSSPTPATDTQLSLIPLGDLSLVDSPGSLPTFSDKAIFPTTILSSILALPQIDKHQLPHPLIFKISSDSTHAYVGVKEFSSPDESSVILPTSIHDLFTHSEVSVHLVLNLPHARFLTLKPLQFYPEITNWKFYLESKLPQFYTSLSKGTTLTIEDAASAHKYELLIEDANDDTVSIIDTDVTLDVVPLNDIMANQQLQYDQNLNYLVNIPTIGLNQVTSSLALKPMAQAVVPQLYRLDLQHLKNHHWLKVEVWSHGPHDEAEVNKGDYNSIFNVDLICSFNKLLSLECFEYSTLDQDFAKQQVLEDKYADAGSAKCIWIDLTSDIVVNNMLRQENFLYLVPFTWEFSTDVSFRLSTPTTKPPQAAKISTSTSDDQTVCGNCRQQIPLAKKQLHEAFCYRHNIRCECGQVFSQQIPSNHWHCQRCDDVTLYHGSSSLLRFKHDKLYHSFSYQCNVDQSQYDNFFQLVAHRATKCGGKLHECQFCHLIVPQEQATFEDNFANLTHHENQCGNKTTECYQCDKILKRKDLVNHIRMHDLAKRDFTALTKITFSKCANVNCVNLLAATPSNEMALCDFCYGPLYSAQHDPTHIKLQSRIERRYMIQLSKGCGFEWCRNEQCLTGRQHLHPQQNSSRDFKSLLAHINENLLSQIVTPRLPINKDRDVVGGNQAWFCVNESIQNRRTIVDAILFEQQYGKEIVYKAVNEAGTGDESQVRSWLVENVA